MLPVHIHDIKISRITLVYLNIILISSKVVLKKLFKIGDFLTFDIVAQKVILKYYNRRQKLLEQLRKTAKDHPLGG